MQGTGAVSVAGVGVTGLLKLCSPGDILLFRPGGDFFSRVIAWGTGSEYSHVAVCVEPGMALAIEANTRGGVRAIDLNASFAARSIDVFRVRSGCVYDLNKTVSYLVTKLNSKYDFAGVIFLGLIKLINMILAFLGRPLRKFANTFQKERDFFCSELCYEAFFAGGLDIVPQIGEAEITAPGDIAKSPVIEKIN